MYVIKRTDQGGGYVAKQGRSGSYTGVLQHARTWYRREDAERERCVENEVIVTVDSELGLC